MTPVVFWTESSTRHVQVASLWPLMSFCWLTHVIHTSILTLKLCSVSGLWSSWERRIVLHLFLPAKGLVQGRHGCSPPLTYGLRLLCWVLGILSLIMLHNWNSLPQSLSFAVKFLVISNADPKIFRPFQKSFWNCWSLLIRASVTLLKILFGCLRVSSKSPLSVYSSFCSSLLSHCELFWGQSSLNSYCALCTKSRRLL